MYTCIYIHTHSKDGTMKPNNEATKIDKYVLSIRYIKPKMKISSSCSLSLEMVDLNQERYTIPFPFIHAKKNL